MWTKFLAVFAALPLFSFAEEFPQVVEMGKLKLFQDILRSEEPDSWSWTLAKGAYELGLASFNDCPEIGAFIALLQREYHIDAAVETGVFLGSTTQFFSLHFDRVHAIEFLESSYQDAKERLKERENVQLYLGSSDEVLEQILPSLQDQRLLFYLDAHTWGNWPLASELEAIAKTHKDNCIIVIDDIQVPGTGIRGMVEGSVELTHDYVRPYLSQIFTGYTFHYLIPRQAYRSAKLVAIPKKWKYPNYQGRVDVLSGFNIYDFPIRLKNVKEAGYEIQMQYRYPSPYSEQNSPHSADLKKIIVFGWTLDPETLLQWPKEKLLFFIMEPMKMPLEYYDFYSRVYTWDDTLVDNVKFFKLHYPYLMPMRPNIPSFEQKKLCVMVSGSDNEYPERPGELYSERMKMVEFFETKPPGDFDIYGRYWVKRYYRDFRGAIPGDHSGEEKMATLEKYRFCICFENTRDVYGYITEKIFACFAAGCVPVYWGAANIESYIPKNCFIDYRDFTSREELYRYMKDCPKEVFEQYLENIRAFLKSEQAQVFSPATFEKAVYDAITGP